MINKLKILYDTEPALGKIEWPKLNKDDIDLVYDALVSKNWGYEGKYEKLFNYEFNRYNRTKYGFLVANGTVSLEIALKACNVGAGDEVILPAATWVGTAYAVKAVGAIPVFVDIDPASLTIDPLGVSNAITNNTKAIIPVHLYGNMADMDSLCEIAKENNLYIIEDCAHAHGSEWKNRKAGSIGDIGSFSFQNAKLITSGEGGFVSTNNINMARKMYGLKNCGRKMDEKSEYLMGSNYRISELQAALLVGQLEKHKFYVRKRYDNRKLLDRLLGQIPGIYPMPLHEKVTNNAQYRYIFKYDYKEFSGLSRAEFVAALESEGILVHSMYTPVYRHELYPDPTINVDRIQGLYNTESAIKDTILLNHSMLLEEQTVEIIYRVICSIKQNSKQIQRMLRK